MSLSSGRKMKHFLTFFAFFLTFNALADAKLTKIEENNWQDLLTGEWMIEFFAPWCPACRGLQPTWEEFAGWSEDLDIGIGQVDVTTSPGLSGRFMVTALPTIFHVKNGVFRQYRGARDKDSFISFVEDKKWSQIEQVAAWTHPDSVQMTMVSYFFKLSMVLRNVHSTLTEEYEFPYWVSYVAFAVATILLGGILGLCLVCCIDCVFPPRREDQHHSHPARDDKKDSDFEEEDDVEELDDEDDGSQVDSQDDEAGSQDESQDSQDDRSQEEEQESPRPGDNKTRRRRARKAD